MTIQSSIGTIRNLILIDQVFKFFSLIVIKGRVVVINGFLALCVRKNTGIAFSMFSTLPEQHRIYLKILIAIALGFLITYFLAYCKKMSRTSWLAMVLMIAGGISNQIDRMLFGAVTDMIELSIFGMKIFTFTCNIADIYTSLGLILYIAGSYAVDARQVNGAKKAS